MELIGRRGCFVGCRLLTLLLPLRLFMLLLSKETASAVFGEIVITSPRVVVVREQHEAPPGAARRAWALTWQVWDCAGYPRVAVEVVLVRCSVQATRTAPSISSTRGNADAGAAAESKA